MASEEEIFPIVTETVVGRTREDYQKFGKRATGYIGKHIVGTGEDTHLTTKVLIDLLKPHVILVSGKRGTGKSYSTLVILEEFCQLEEDFRKKLAFVVVDPMGIYWSMKFPNEQQASLLKEWGLEPKGFKDFVQVFVPEKQKESYERAGIPIDGTISISLKEFSAEDLILAFGFKRTEEIAIALEKNFNKLLASNKTFGFEELIEEVKKDEETRVEIKNALMSLLEVSRQWGLIVKEGIRIEDLVQPGKVTIIDLSRLASTELRSLLVALLARKIYHTRVLARKEEERVKIEGGKPEITFPITWFVIEECLPSDAKIVTDKGNIPIGDLVCRHKNGENFKVLAYDETTGEYDYYNVTKSFEIKPRKLLRIKTETGKEIKCTPDHLVLSKNGFVSAKNAESIASPLVYPYPQDKRLVIARLVGHLYGDGWLSKKEVGFSGSTDRDLLFIKNDISFLGFSSSDIYERESESEITTMEGKKIKVKGRGKSLSSSVKAYKFFLSLGLPDGNKTTQAFLLPKWLMESSLEEKAEFLAALMGSDGYIQSPMKKSPQSFPPIRLSFNKIFEFKQNALEYANQLKQLFEELGIKVSRISVRKGNIRKDGKKTLKFVITLSNSISNIIRFLDKVGFRYCEKKEIEARKMLAYLNAKMRAVKEREKLYRKAVNLWKKGYSKHKISRIIGVSRPVIRRWVSGNTKVRAYTFPSYREWIKKRSERNLIFEKIISKSLLKSEPLFDITVENVHNFIADGFVVHNCHNFIPSDKEVASSDAIKRLAKEGREPGIGLLVITQMPNKVHQDILSQCDLVISFRLTSRDDLQALHAVMQTYMAEEIEKFINRLPRWPGAAIILDDNLEKVFTVNIRPRLSWHAGGTAAVI